MRGEGRREKYSGRVAGTCGATTANMSLKRALFMMRSDSVVVVREGEALTSNSQGRSFESIRTS
jgi:hypothetical protein